MSTEPADRPRLPAPGAAPPKAKRSGLASGAMAAAGIAAGVAATLGVSEMTDAFGVGGGGPDDAMAPDTPLEDAVFDEVAGPFTGSGGGNGFGGGGGGGTGGGGHRPGGRGPARPGAADEGDAELAAGAPRPDVAAGTAMGGGGDGEFEAARERVLRSLDDWEAPEGADPEEAAALRAELADRIERFVPSAGQTLDEAVAALRDQVDDEVKDFAQDERIEAIVDELRADDPATLLDDFDETAMHAMPWDDPATEHDEREGLPADQAAVEPAELPDVVGDAPPAGETEQIGVDEAEPAWVGETEPMNTGIWIEPWQQAQDDPELAPIDDGPEPVMAEADIELGAPVDDDGGFGSWGATDDAPTTIDEMPAEPAMG